MAHAPLHEDDVAAALSQVYPGAGEATLGTLARESASATAADCAAALEAFRYGPDSPPSARRPESATARRIDANLARFQRGARDLRDERERNAAAYVARYGSLVPELADDVAAAATRALAPEQPRFFSVAKGQYGIPPSRPSQPMVPGGHSRDGVAECFGTLIADHDREILEREYSFGGKTERAWPTLTHA